MLKQTSASITRAHCSCPRSISQSCLTCNPYLLTWPYRIDAGAVPCVWFYDLRFVVPGRETLPFRYGLCRNGEGWERFELLADGLRRALR